MAIFSRITNLTRGLWIANTRPSDGETESLSEGELAQELAQRRPPRTPARTAAPTPVPAPAAPPGAEPTRPVERDADGNVKRSL